MDHIGEWLNLLGRWFHIVAGISWIGSSFYFMWLDSALEKGSSDPRIAGSLWMVHGGGFYRVEKRILGPGEVPPGVHWFRFEALSTWLSGLFLLGIVYYWGGLMVESPFLSPWGYACAGLGVIALTWLVYDRIWSSRLADRVEWLACAITLLWLLGVSAFAGYYLGPRSSFIHIGAALGTLMVANVWLRILPAQKRMIAATQSGQPLDLKLSARAKRRSVHNNYITFPVLFIMISSHFPSTYGHPYNWLVLFALALASMCVRHFLNVRRHAWLLAVALMIVVCLIWMTQ